MGQSVSARGSVTKRRDVVVLDADHFFSSEADDIFCQYLPVLYLAQVPALM